MPALRLMLLILIASLVALPASSLPIAQTTQPECTDLVQRAVETVGASCDGLSRNQACYGNRLIEVEFLPDQSFTFGTSGDTVDLTSLRRISTMPFEGVADQWGIAVLKAQVNLPENLPGQNVTFLLFGDASLENPTPDMQLVKVETNLNQGVECEEAPSGLLIQSPHGAQVEMALNGADVILGSTVYITAVADEVLTLITLDGAAVVTAFDQVRVVLEGDQITIPIGEDWLVTGEPSETEPIDPDLVQHLPVTLLEDEIILPEASGETNLSTPTATPVLCFPRTDWTSRYTVQLGDTLGSIASRAGVNLQTLQTANCIADPNVIRAGDVLTVPFPVPTLVPPITVTAPPTVSFYAVPSTITLGECVTVAWNVGGPVNSVIIGQISVAPQGSATDCNLRVTTIIDMYVSRPDGTTETYSVTITVQDVCGDNICGYTEDYLTCSADCSVPTN